MKANAHADPLRVTSRRIALVLFVGIRSRKGIRLQGGGETHDSASLLDMQSEGVIKHSSMKPIHRLALQSSPRLLQAGRSGQYLFQEPPVKSKFLAGITQTLAYLALGVIT